jgi:hypothetical protein
MAEAQSSEREEKPLGTRHYPSAHDKSKIGTYGHLCASGGGHRYDRVLEYRVWVRYDGMPSAKCFSFSSHDDAAKFRSVLPKKDKTYDRLVVLVEQDWYYVDPQGAPQNMLEIRQNRKTEWDPVWLDAPQACRTA